MWYFVSPKIAFGDGALETLDELKGRRALIVTDTSLVRLGLVGKVAAHLDKAGLSYRIFDAVQPDPDLVTVQAGAQLAQDESPDWIIGLGGGSCLDAAKAIWILYERPDLDPAEINPFIELGLRKKARLITIPTTSGTGAEVTWAIVLTDTQARRKLGLGNRENVADIAIVDPELVAGLPPRLTASTGLDALTHAIEGYTCTWHNDLTDGLCLQAAKLVMRYLPRAVADGADREARERMHNAATMAGLGFGNALASLAHATGHSLGAILHVPHGQAVGLCLPYTIEYIGAEASERFAEMAAFLGVAPLDDAEAAPKLARRVRELCQTVGAPTSLADLGVVRDRFEGELEALVEGAFSDGTMLTTARSPSYQELELIYRYMYEGKPIDF
ncbi:MAG: iron-containing alcohol dehydrogenase [Chloroflexi bacterium]|nr:iron-containing alcohol dehydrogenase [Chloroflexota bacterium]